MRNLFTIFGFLMLITTTWSQREIQISAYYAPQSGKIINWLDILEGTSKRPSFIGGKHGISATYFFDRNQYFGFETGIARSRTGGNLTSEFDNPNGLITNEDLYNQQFIYTKIPILLTLNKLKKDLFGFVFKVGFEYGRLAYAQNYYWNKNTLAFNYNNRSIEDVKFNAFSRTEDNNLVDFVQYFNGISNYELQELYNQNTWSFLAEFGVRYQITAQFDLNINLFLDLGFSNINNLNAQVNHKYFWQNEHIGVVNFGDFGLSRAISTINNYGLKFSLVYRLYDLSTMVRNKFEINQ